MRAQIAYAELLVDENDGDADVMLLEARQNCRKLELDFFMAQIEILRARAAANRESWDEARAHLNTAEELHGALQECDRKQVQPKLEKATKEIDRLILQTSIRGAEELKTICQVYEDARFPMEEMRSDLAYRVAQTVDAESLFLVRRVTKGYEIPIAYNIRRKDAREIVRRLDRDRSVPILGVDGDPRAMTAYTGRMLFIVPGDRYVLCALFGKHGPLSPRQFEHLLTSVIALERLAEEQEEGPRAIDDELLGVEGSSRLAHPRGSFEDILTVDPEMIKLIHLAERAADSEVPILLSGETGVGKELFARAIHGASPRQDGPFVAINAGGMPVHLLESQLFGHVKGAFTDAVKDRKGLIKEAEGGTVFFDEIGEMGEELQVKLLRLLENGEYRRLGDNEVQMADVRVISATNRDLAREVERGSFRRDLFYRLGAVNLAIPSLRFRKNDVPLLIRHFLKECAARNRRTDRTFQVDVKAVEAMTLYDWPGNVRELHNEVFRVVSLIGNNDTIRFGMLSDGIKDFVKKKHRSDGLLEQSVDQYERNLILAALERNDWNRLRTADEIGIPRTTLLAKMKRFNIAPRENV
jgi:DNA-binding NtrC family response regulator